jgi:hypothetical protein
MAEIAQPRRALTSFWRCSCSPKPLVITMVSKLFLSDGVPQWLQCVEGLVAVDLHGIGDDGKLSSSSFDEVRLAGVVCA